MAQPTEEEIASVMEVLPQGEGRSAALALLKRARAGGSDEQDSVSIALNTFFSGAAASASTSTGGATEVSPIASTAFQPSNKSASKHPASPFQLPASKPSSTAPKLSGTKRPRPPGSDPLSATAAGPLAERVRPATLSDLVGQSAFTPESSLGRLLAADQFPSVILWGPPGCGKTTVASLVAEATKRRAVRLSATRAGVKEVREIVEEAGRRRRKNPHAGTLLFLDEIHRWNKAQQDVLLPHVESGSIVLVGATTENPSFSLNNALLSRCRVVTMDGLDTESLLKILRSALSNSCSGWPANDVRASDDVLRGLAVVANGDARQALNALEFAVKISKPAEGPITLSAETVQKALQRKQLMYDREGEEHYNIISALHKSMRAGEVDASLYWLARMLEGGEDARYISRRLVRFAAEDIGLADPDALLQATAAHRAAEKVGMPECDVILAQAVAYLALAPKSVAVYSAYKAAKQLAKDAPADPVPMHIRNAPTGLMKKVGYGKGYTYNPEHGYKRGCSDGLSFFPDSLKGTRLFDETDIEAGYSLYPSDKGSKKNNIQGHLK